MSLTLEEYEQLQPNVQVDGMAFYTPNMHCAWRIDTLYTKEPDTIEWIRKMKPGSILFDIGANIGQYSIFAAKHGVHVFAFEPESQNFAILIRNISMNGMQDRIFAYPFCISDVTKIDMLRLSSLMPGGSCHSFGTDQNYKGEVKQWASVQGSVAFSVDELVEGVGFTTPTHIKIDVDGLEAEVLRGMAKTLHRVQSILVEMDSAQERHMEWKHRLENEYGFRTDETQIMAARRKDGAFQGIGNIIFTRVEQVSEVTNPGTAEVLPSLGIVETVLSEDEHRGLQQAPDSGVHTSYQAEVVPAVWPNGGR